MSRRITLAVSAALAFLAGGAAGYGATYQKSVAFKCPAAAVGFGVCTAKFNKIPQGKRLKPALLSCSLGASNVGLVVKIGASAFGASPVFPATATSSKPRIYLTWNVLDEANTIASMSAQVPLQIPAGKSPEVVVRLLNDHPLGAIAL